MKTQNITLDIALPVTIVKHGFFSDSKDNKIHDDFEDTGQFSPKRAPSADQDRV